MHENVPLPHVYMFLHFPARTIITTKRAVTYDEVYQYLSKADSKYAANCSESRRRAIRKFSKNVVLVDGVLHYDERKWISDSKLQQQILKLIHSDSSGRCHFGRDKTREKIAKRYYWHGMYDDIDLFVKTCIDCQKVAMTAS